MLPGVDKHAFGDVEDEAIGFAVGALLDAGALDAFTESI